MQVHGSIHTLRIRATFEEVCFWEKIITFYLITFGSLIRPQRLHDSHVPIFSAPIWPRERQIHSWKGSFFLKSSCDSQNLLFFWPRTLNGQLAFGWSIIQKLWMVIDWLTSHKYPTLSDACIQPGGCKEGRKWVLGSGLLLLTKIADAQKLVSIKIHF